MIELDVIRPVKEPTDWVSSITYVHKPDGSLRICLDPKPLCVHYSPECKTNAIVSPGRWNLPDPISAIF